MTAAPSVLPPPQVQNQTGRGSGLSNMAMMCSTASLSSRFGGGLHAVAIDPALRDRPQMIRRGIACGMKRQIGLHFLVRVNDSKDGVNVWILSFPAGRCRDQVLQYRSSSRRSKNARATAGRLDHLRCRSE